MKFLKKSFSSVPTLLLILLALTSCNSTQKNLSSTEFEKELSQAFKRNPEILKQAIQDHPMVVMDALKEAADKAQVEMAKKREDQEKKQLEATYDNPLKFAIRSDENIIGKKDAPLTLVMYSDFECPYCSRGYETAQAIRKKYGEKVRFIYKHLPLSFHKQAMLSAQYYEAIRLQSSEKAFKFYQELFENQRSVSKGNGFFLSVAKKLKVNVAKLEKDLSSKAVIDRITEDKTEANSLGFQGTPGFLLNGVPVKGAYPATYFDNIVEELKKRGKVKL